MTTKEQIMQYIAEKGKQYPEGTKPIFRVAVLYSAEEQVYPSGKHSGFPKDAPEDVGFYYDFDDAYEAIRTNACDIRETCYDYAMLMTAFPGLYEYSVTETRMMFRYNTETNAYEQMEEPEWFRHSAF